MNSSLLICMNEVNQVLKYKIVPNDGRSFIESMIKSIVHDESRAVETKVIFTNNARADSAILKGMFIELELPEVDVLQV